MTHCTYVLGEGRVQRKCVYSYAAVMLHTSLIDIRCINFRWATWFDTCRYCKMITTISLVNIYHHTQLQDFFLVMRTFMISSLSDFQIPNTVLLTTVTMLFITSPWLSYFITGSLYLWVPSPISPHPTSPLLKMAHSHFDLLSSSLTHCLWVNSRSPHSMPEEKVPKPRHTELLKVFWRRAASVCVLDCLPKMFYVFWQLH